MAICCFFYTSSNLKTFVKHINIQIVQKKYAYYKNTDHGHEQSEGLLEGLGGWGQRGKNWDNCNSIINEMHLKNKKVKHQEMHIIFISTCPYFIIFKILNTCLEVIIVKPYI